MTNNEIIEHLATNFNANQLLDAFLCHEMPFRLSKIHNLDEENTKHMKDDLIVYFQNNPDALFNYDAIDNIIAEYIRRE